MMATAAIAAAVPIQHQLKYFSTRCTSHIYSTMYEVRTHMFYLTIYLTQLVWSAATAAAVGFIFNHWCWTYYLAKVHYGFVRWVAVPRGERAFQRLLRTFIPFGLTVYTEFRIEYRLMAVDRHFDPVPAIGKSPKKNAICFHFICVVDHSVE